MKLPNRKCPGHKFMYYREYSVEGACPKCGGYFGEIKPVPEGYEFIGCVTLGNNVIVKYESEKDFLFKYAVKENINKIQTRLARAGSPAGLVG